MALPEKLIKCVKKNPILFDFSHENYKNSKKKDMVWKQIGSELKENSDSLCKKWKNLRDTYTKFLKNGKKVTSGPASKRSKRWHWADQMEFYRPFVTLEKSSIAADLAEIYSETDSKYPVNVTIKGSQPQLRKSYSNVDTASRNLNVVDSSDSEYRPTSISVARTTKKRKRSHKDSFNGTRLSDSSIDDLQGKKRCEVDAIDSLFLAHAQTVKTFSVTRQALAKMEIAKVIMKQELLQEEEKSTSAWMHHCNCKFPSPPHELGDSFYDDADLYKSDSSVPILQRVLEKREALQMQASTANKANGKICESQSPVKKC